MTTSFPFLKIARDRGIDYGDVIRLVEKCWDAAEPGIVTYNPILFGIWDAVVAEKRRRALNEPKTVAWDVGRDYTGWKPDPDSGSHEVKPQNADWRA
jgi:hypothetical protein